MIRMKNLIFWVIVFTFFLTTFPTSAFAEKQKGSFYINAGGQIAETITRLQEGGTLMRDGETFPISVTQENEEMTDEELISAWNIVGI